MPDDLSPTLRRWDLGRTLRRIRESQGKTIEQVSADLSEMYATGFSATKIGRLETAKRGANPRDVRDLCNYYGVNPEERDRLVMLARAARAENDLQGVPDAYAEFVPLEAMARVEHNYEPMFVPGLLQTIEYHRAAIDDYALSGLDSDSSDEKYKTLIHVRRERQRLLSKPDPLIYYAIIDENVLRRRVGSNAVMASQLEHLVEMSLRPNITLRVVPASRGVYPGCESAGLAMLEFDHGESTPDSVCMSEGFIATVWAERAADKARIRRTLKYIETIAFDVDQSRDFIIENKRRFAYP